MSTFLISLEEGGIKMWEENNLHLNIYIFDSLSVWIGKFFPSLSNPFQIYMVYNKRSGKPRGYAFIEYEHERDMHCKYIFFWDTFVFCFKTICLYY